MNKRLSAPLALAGLTLALVACGGSDGEDVPSVTSEVPASASASVDGWIEYLKQLIVAAADTLEPVDTSTVVPPTSETTEPAVVD